MQQIFILLLGSVVATGAHPLHEHRPTLFLQPPLPHQNRNQNPHGFMHPENGVPEESASSYGAPPPIINANYGPGTSYYHPHRQENENTIKYVSVFVAPPPNTPPEKIHLPSTPPTKRLNIIFIKNPSYSSSSIELPPPPPLPKTIVYLLNEKTPLTFKPAAPSPTQSQKPEVFFLNYKNEHTNKGQDLMVWNGEGGGGGGGQIPNWKGGWPDEHHERSNYFKSYSVETNYAPSMGYNLAKREVGGGGKSSGGGSGSSDFRAYSYAPNMHHAHYAIIPN